MIAFVAALALCGAAFAALGRLVIGPTLHDRAMAAHVALTCLILAVAALAVLDARPAWLDVALAAVLGESVLALATFKALRLKSLQTALTRAGGRAMNDVLGAIEGARHILAGGILVLGLILLASAVSGMMRFPDFFTRIHAAALAPIGAAVILAALAIEAWDGALALRLGMLGALIVALMPWRLHLMASGAHGGGLAPLIGRLSVAPRKAET